MEYEYVEMELPRLQNARYMKDYIIELEFNDGVKGKVDFTNNLDVGPLKELTDKELFSKFEVHPIAKTLVWPNGADIAPEFLRENLQ